MVEVQVEENDIKFWKQYIGHYVIIVLDDKSKFGSKKEDQVVGVDSTHVHLESEGSIGRQYIIRIKSLKGKWEDNPEYGRR